MYILVINYKLYWLGFYIFETNLLVLDVKEKINKNKQKKINMILIIIAIALLILIINIDKNNCNKLI